MTPLRTRRHALGARQQDVAERAGITASHLSRLERRAAWIVSPGTRERVERALGAMEVEAAAVRLVKLLLWGRR